MKWTAVAAIWVIGANAISIAPRSPSFAARATQEDDDPEGCGFELSEGFEFPHLIIPVNASAPDHAPGTSYHGEVSEDISSIFNFDIPRKENFDTCSLVFLFPGTSERPPNSYTFEGDGNVEFSKLEGPASTRTTYNNAPKVAEELGEATLEPGSSINVATFPCTQSETLTFKVSNTGSTNFKYFQDYGVPPFGLYITRCQK